MSRTYRKRPESFEAYYKWLLANPETAERWGWDVKRERAKYKTKTMKWYAYNLPKDFRNMINRKRRAYDRQELWKEVNISEHEGQYSKWNCKDNRAWDYW